MGMAVGMDLGTTYSVVAVMDRLGKPRILPNSFGRPTTPSVVCATEDGILVGEEAKARADSGGEHVASLFKRYMGNPDYRACLRGEHYTAVELSTLILSQLKADAERGLGSPVDAAVITVPAYFNDTERRATIEAGERAGLKVLRIINEPTAAALAYGFSSAPPNQRYLVYDLGGGTFDVTVVKTTEQNIAVLGTAGDHKLGGSNWDARLAELIAHRFQEEFDLDLLAAERDQSVLTAKAERAKKDLSSLQHARVQVTCQGQQACYEVTRAEFEATTQDLVERTELLCLQALNAVGLTWRSLHGVLLVGGATRMPMVQAFIERVYGQPPLRGVNVDEAVALGAAIQAKLDTVEAEDFRLSAVKPVIDVMSHSLGMVSVSADGSRYINAIIVPKNQPIPVAESRPFQVATQASGPNEVDVFVLQGEDSDPTRCASLGKYTFADIRHVEDRPAVLDIRYAYDRNGVIQLSAIQRGFGCELPITVSPVPPDMSWLSKAPATTTGALSVLFAIDLSYSMHGKPLREAQLALRQQFLGNLDLTRCSVGLLGFADRVELSPDLCQNAAALDQAITQWTPWVEQGHLGFGNGAEPFSQARLVLASRCAPRFLVVLTDGCWADQPGAIKRAAECHSAGIEIIAVGFGSADEGFLKRIATSGDNALFTDLAGLGSSFSRIAQVLTESGLQMQHDLAPGARSRGMARFFP